ncbi:MAG: AraC family transcriptional regulator [Bacteroidia bacterium]|nr:AraC family transcriptional regulator [Bacteroidia bacterium]
MKKEETKILQFSSISDAHRAFGLPKPVHPLISLIDNSIHHIDITTLTHSHALAFYKISYKPRHSGKLKYGQGYYDFDEGGLLFASPGQIIGHHTESDINDCSQYTLLIHPDFLLNYPLAKNIKQYGFFSYSVNEALHWSDQEKEIILSIFKNIGTEINSRIDEFSQDVIISQIELLLNYSNRFYKRQFITRKAVHNEYLVRLETIFEEYFSDEKFFTNGLPTVQFLADKLNISPSYLSDMLRSLTGQNAQQHIHSKIIENAKIKLSATDLTISEIAYQLGFEHPQSFSRLFKNKTNLSPVEFRASFN